MDPVVVPLVWLIVGATLVVLTRSMARRQRTAHIGNERFGLTLEVGGSAGPRAEGPFPLFAADPGVKESVLVDGEVETFDYRCDRGEDGLITDRRTCAATSIDAACPPLAISRRSRTGPPAALLPEVRFEAGVFNEQVRVRCADPRFAQALVDQRMMEWLLLFPPGWGIQVADDGVLAYGPVTKPWEREPLVAMLRDFISHLPASLASQYPR